ncbi:adhesion G-protein coupled receptor D1-like [Mercenaria mercenaria]|uniref:adhesion G-protein coupled receptor D1-like n=1 Tax=Mercenaria mercenaria TaxID=6596 RepID=UPI00234E683D|nr:adhesion G-protein coupled receptor D1-like [Mercenaria mercenaria]
MHLCMYDELILILIPKRDFSQPLTSNFRLEEIHIASLEILTIIGCCISIAALSTTVTVLLWFRLRSERYILLLHLSVAVVVAQVVFLTGIDAVNMKIVCRLVAILLHYLYLSVFTLMLAEGIHLFHKLHRAFDADDSLNMLLFLGWGSPFVIVSLSLLSAGDGYSTQQHCWLSTDGAIWAFVGPALTIIAINMAILIMIIRTFLGVTIVARKTDMQKFKASLKATVVLLPLLGITWMFGVVAVNESTVVFQYIFAILNSLQGLFIFLFHIVFNDDVRKACSHYKRNQITSVDSLPQSSASKKLHKKASILDMFI